MTDPIVERIRRKYADLEQDGLFEPPEATRSEEPQNKVAKPKVVDRVTCDICQHAKVAVVRVLDDGFRPHYILREHYRTTLSGHRFVCAGSGSEQPT